MRKIYLVIAALVFLAAACNQKPPLAQPHVSGQPTAAATSTPTQASSAPALFPPISNALARITKKPFGIYVTPQNSPVQPEKFTGYHTGVDFETTPQEQNIDVPIFAACDGKLLLKEYASGYGGVAVQACVINDNPVTIIYGHLRLSSISPKVGDSLKAGQQIAVLGTGYTSETDGERKNLHFGIHKGSAINILGYVQNKADLSGWLDPEKYLQ